MSDDDDECGGLYENGHWEWDDDLKGLKFVSHINEMLEGPVLAKGTPTGAILFRDDYDYFEQVRYKNRYQRKVKFGQREVITVQDVKDIAIFTAPMNIMSEKLINMLHRPTTERFIRALILYCQYYMQMVDKMAERKKIFESKLRTQQSDEIENEYRENLCDLRLLVAKQYCTMIIGGADMKSFHHMGIRRSRSMSDRDAIFYETFLLMCIQIVYLALGRKHYNRIELEVNRLFKTDIFNTVEKKLHTGYITNMTSEERNVLLGQCLRHDNRTYSRSPMVNEVFCHRYIDYRLMSLADVKHDKLTPRLQFLHRAVVAPEEDFEENHTVVGILGQPRSRFDAMLNPLPVQQLLKSSSKLQSGSQNNYSGAKVASTKRSAHDVAIAAKLYNDIDLPPKAPADNILPESFPDTLIPVRRCNLEQRDRWISRHNRLLNSRKSTIG